jgi:hypothetical protein
MQPPSGAFIVGTAPGQPICSHRIARSRQNHAVNLRFTAIGEPGCRRPVWRVIVVSVDPLLSDAGSPRRMDKASAAVALVPIGKSRRVVKSGIAAKDLL